MVFLQHVSNNAARKEGEPEMLVDERGLLDKWKIHSCKKAQDGLACEQDN